MTAEVEFMPLFPPRSILAWGEDARSATAEPEVHPGSRSQTTTRALRRGEAATAVPAVGPRRDRSQQCERVPAAQAIDTIDDLIRVQAQDEVHSAIPTVNKCCHSPPNGRTFGSRLAPRDPNPPESAGNQRLLMRSHPHESPCNQAQISASGSLTENRGVGGSILPLAIA
jgi:hypothetical protein